MAAARPRIAHGLFTWRDGRVALEACLRSTAGHVDEVIIADGLIKGVADQGLPWHSDLGWLADADYLPARVPISTKEWETLSAACTWILHQAKRLRCDWLLFIDADQELHNGAALRDHLAAYTGDAFPLSRADKTRHPVPWQCLRVAAFRRYIAGCFIVEHERWGECSLVPHDLSAEIVVGEDAPWISHHPERRPPGRHAHRLGDLETVLEPPPWVPPLQIAPLVVEPSIVTDAAEPLYFCDQCGARYFGPGVCENAHPPHELKKVADAEAEENPSSGTPTLVEVTPPAEESPPETSGDDPAKVEAADTTAPVEPPPSTPAEHEPSLLDEAKAALAHAHDLLSRL